MTSEPAAPTATPDLAAGMRPADGRTYRIEVSPHHCFVCGDLNAHGLRLAILTAGGRAWSELTLGREHEGWEGIAHGGILAALLDEVMGWALFEHDCWGVTAELTTRYRRPVEVGRRIRAEGWVTGVRRRVFHTAGRIVDAADGTLLCEAEAVYIAAPAEKRAALKARYGFRLVPVDEAGA